MQGENAASKAILDRFSQLVDEYASLVDGWSCE